MLLKALISSETPVSNMANGGAAKVSSIPANTIVTLTDLKRDGANAYYYVEDYNGYVKKNYVKILRDEEFYYSSSLLQTKSNRSLMSTFALARAAVTQTPVNPVKDANSNVDINISANSSTTNGMLTSSVGLINSYDGGISAANNASIGGNLSSMNSKTDISIKTLPKTTTESKGWSGLDTSKTAAAIATELMTKIASGNTNRVTNTLLSTGISVASEFASTGKLNMNTINTMNIGSMFGNSTAGKLLNGMNINNLNDGSFFKTVLKQNAVNTITSYINTLLTKLNYIVGFNLSGILLNVLVGTGIIPAAGSGLGVQYDNMLNRYKWNNIYDLETKIARWFRYAGCNYKMITRYGDGMQKWEQEAYFNTPVLSSRKDPNEVREYQTLYHTFYNEFENSINVAKEGMNLNITDSDWLINFNRYRISHPDTVLTTSKGYIFFTRPDLNISKDVLSNDMATVFFNIAGRYPNITSSLTKSYSGNHQFLPILCNRCTGIDISDEQLETKELGDTLTGWKLNYGTNMIKSKGSGTINTGFVDDNKLSIYALFKLWCEYISAVSRGLLSPKRTYIQRKQLDYAISIYYFLCSEDGENIIFWTKYTGCIPTSVPSSNFSDSVESAIRMPKYTIGWQYAFKRDLDVASLAEFNKLTGSGFNYKKMYNPNTLRTTTTISGAPFVETRDGGKTYKLRFREKYS